MIQKGKGTLRRRTTNCIRRRLCSDFLDVRNWGAYKIMGTMGPHSVQLGVIIGTTIMVTRGCHWALMDQWHFKHYHGEP